MRYLLLTTLPLASCGLSPADVQATIDALPTQTTIPSATATMSPTATEEPARPTAFVISLDIAKGQLEDWDYRDLGTTECFVKSTPVWMFCHSFAYALDDELISGIQLLHDGDVLLGLVWLDPDGPTPRGVSGGDVIDIAVHFRVPLIFFDSNVREDDFYYFVVEDGSGSLHAWLDYRLAEVVCSSPLFCR